MFETAAVVLRRNHHFADKERESRCLLKTTQNPARTYIRTRTVFQNKKASQATRKTFEACGTHFRSRAYPLVERLGDDFTSLQARLVLVFVLPSGRELSDIGGTGGEGNQDFDVQDAPILSLCSSAFR
jgi:hypothetical protein